MQPRENNDLQTQQPLLPSVIAIASTSESFRVRNRDGPSTTGKTISLVSSRRRRTSLLRHCQDTEQKTFEGSFCLQDPSGQRIQQGGDLHSRSSATRRANFIAIHTTAGVIEKSTIATCMRGREVYSSFAAEALAFGFGRRLLGISTLGASSRSAD